MKEMSIFKTIMGKGPCHMAVFFKAVLLVGFIVALHAPFAIAQPVPADTPCDPNYYDSLESRAWMEAQREITQNQNLIFKPDSVFEYTCFDRHMNVLAQQAQNMFSENTRWGTVLSADSMDNALQNLVGTALKNYIDGNFEHDLLGGRLEGIDYDPQDISGGSYNCDIMNQVWMKAKCMSFVQKGGDGYTDATGEDGFFTFAEYAADPDKRFLPERCPSIGGRWDLEINQALFEGGTPWTEDTTLTYLERLDPANCDDLDPIATGVIVGRGKDQPRFYLEKLCIAPGCHYVPTGTANDPNNPSTNGSCVPN